MIVFWILGFFALSSPGPAGSAQAVFLGDRHKNLGVDCSGCHKEDPPKQNVPMAVCLGCHGDYPKLAERTDKITPNPHDSHLGEIDCGQCHHAHKASVLVCAGCHLMDMKVP